MTASIDTFKVAKHTRGGADGVKKKRPNIRLVPAFKFRKIGNVAALYEELFGPTKELM